MNYDSKVLEMDQRKSGIRMSMSLLLLVSDICCFLLAGFLAIMLRVVFNDLWRVDLYIQIVPVLIISTIFFGFTGLYPAIGVGPVEELRKLVSMTSLVMLSLTAASFWVRNAENFSRLTLGLTWLFSIGLLPLGRELVKSIGIRANIWGEPIAIIGYGKQGQWALEYFRKNSKLGLYPVVVMDLSESKTYADPDILVLKSNDLLLGKRFDQVTGVKTAILILSDVPPEFLDYITSGRQGGFDRLILVPSLENIGSYGVLSFDFGGVLGLEVRHNLLDFKQQALKRTFDILFVLIGGLVISPILLLIALLVLFDSKGSMIYKQSRIGMGGRKFMALKFRTMVRNADAILKDYLEKDPELRKEWDATIKLKNDPRITRLGRFLRKYSLDEFPQLLNVLKGDMSLVGPRPIVDDEVHHYGDTFDPYTWVRPGITGMWQVSGRSDTAYKERVHLDEYYIRNWSMWLDIHILARTVFAVIKKQGAY